jgi:hypothetical protein
MADRKLDYVTLARELEQLLECAIKKSPGTLHKPTVAKKPFYARPGYAVCILEIEKWSPRNPYHRPQYRVVCYIEATPDPQELRYHIDCSVADFVIPYIVGYANKINLPTRLTPPLHSVTEWTG